MRDSVRTARNFSPARNVRSITAPSDAAPQLRADERAALAGLDVLELDDLEDDAVDVDVVPVLELVGADAHRLKRIRPERAGGESHDDGASDGRGAECCEHSRPALAGWPGRAPRR